LILIMVISISAFVYLQQDQSTAAASKAEYPLEISIDEAAVRRDQGAFILDVRQPEEWEEYHIPDSTLIPLGDLPNRLSEVPKNQEVVVVCRSGNRSQSGRDILRNAGFSTVTSMNGGLNQWRASGYETVSGP
jgi:rhodanese-related sulfurtransferase